MYQKTSLIQFAFNCITILKEKIDLIHEQVIRGDKNQVYKLLDKKGWANARDHYGHSALHKSVSARQGKRDVHVLAADSCLSAHRCRRGAEAE